MKKLITLESKAFTRRILLFVLLLTGSAGTSLFAHDVTGYTPSCNSGPVYAIIPHVINVNSSSNYGWQYKNNANAWVCIVNGNNTINGTVYTVTGALSTLTTNPAPLVFTNPGAGLNGLVVRCVISDGVNVNPCSMPAGNTWNSGSTSNNITINVAGTPCGGSSNCSIGGVNLGNLINYLFVFTDASYEGKWQSSSKGYVGNVAVDGNQANQTTSGSFPYAGTIYTNSSTLSNWQSIVNNNSGQAYSSVNQSTLINSLEADLNSAFTQINALPVTAGFNGINPTSLDGLNTTNGIAQTIVINVTSGFTISSKINITGDAGDIFIFRWDDDANFSNGYGGTVKFQSGGAIVPLGGLKPSNFIHVAGNLGSSGGGTNPASPYPQGPRTNNGTGTLINGGQDFNGGGFFTGYWLTTGKPSDRKTDDFSNAIFVGGWYTSTIKFKMTSGTSGVYVAPNCSLGGTGSIGDRVWNDANNNGLQDASETGGIQGVPIQLKNSNGSVIATTTSGANGAYIFNYLPAGSYKVVFPPTFGGATLSPAKVGTNNAIDSDPNQTTGETALVTLSTGQQITTVDAGYYGYTGLTLGNKVFFDANRSGLFDAGDGPIANTIVRLYKDDNNDNVPDGNAIAFTTTDAFGEYQFENLAPGNYIVGADIPETYAITILNGGDPDNDIDNDNNALRVVGTEARGNAITLTFGGEPSGGGNVNNTYDFGFYNPLAPPNGGQECFGGTNPVVYAKSYWNANVNSQTVTVRVTFAKSFVDNTYGSNAINWPNGHTFSQLVGSDHLQWSLKNGQGTEVLRFKQDYISADPTAPSGYNTLGFGGDGGTPTIGNAADVLSFRTSLATNFNNYNYVLTTNSPVTDTNYTPNPSYPNWIYEVWYEVTLKASAFGNSGFGFVDVASVHASPSKTGNNTEIITHDSCASGSIGDRVWNDVNKNGIQDSGEVGISGVLVSLYDGATNKILATTVTDGYGNYLFNYLPTSVAGTNYQVRFSLAPGYQFSPNNGAVSVANNSDANIATGRTGTITLTNAAPNVSYVDAGMYYTETARLGDFVWNDLNKNGIQDAGEPGIAGVPVMLYTSGNVLYRSTITSNNGYYFFNEVPAGTYYIKVTPPIGYQASPKDATTDDIDSDIDPVTFKTGNYTVTAGTINLTIDAGLNVTGTTGASASLGDRVWEDLNNNNLQDAGEPGVANVTVQLFNGSNVLQATATTDAFGNYIFNGLVPGAYYVKFGLPAGYSFVTANVGADDTIDSDADGTGTSQTVTLVDDEINVTVDAGLRRTITGLSSLGDFVWYDLNKNGLQDGGSEVGVPGVTVLLYNNANTVIATTTTDRNGFYLFTGLSAGTYTVGFENLPAGYGFSPNNGAVTVANNSDVNPSTGRTGNIVVAANTSNTYVDAGLIITPNTFDSKATVGDRLWNDLDNNGLQDAGEPGISGVTVTLYAGNGTTVIATTVTDATGNYLFTNLPAGTYVVGFGSLPTGYVFATQNVGSDDTIDSDVYTATGKTDPFTLAAGEINLTLDAGARNTNAALSAIGDFVWIDLNNNGIQDNGEPGVAGVSVELTNMNGDFIKSTTTDAAGRYLLTDIPEGNYFVRFANLPAGYGPAIKNAPGSTSLNNSDGNTATLKTDIIILPASTIDRSWDMGIVSTTRASLGDYVWNDLNQNGIQDSNEPGVSGVTVTLFDNNNVAVSKTITDANGYYLFSNLLPGTYNVGFGTIPASSVFTVQNAAGSTADNNSDADPATGKTANFALTAGQAKRDIDAGLVSLKASVGDFVWFDLNRNGIQDANEAGVPGTTVTLYRSTNTIIGDADDVAVASAVTDANGYYLINNVPVAVGGSQFYMRYTDVQTIYSGFTSPLVGGAAASNNSKVTSQPLTDGRSGFFTLSPNQVYLDMDAGLTKQINLSGFVWNDANGMDDNLVNQTSTVPIPVGLRVYLVNFSNGGIIEKLAGIPFTTGAYNFTNVNPNTNYRVYLTTQALVIGSVFPATGWNTLPGTWGNTGEHLGITPGSDGIANGWLNVPVGVTSVINANFGIRENGGGGQQ